MEPKKSERIIADSIDGILDVTDEELLLFDEETTTDVNLEKDDTENLSIVADNTIGEFDTTESFRIYVATKFGILFALEALRGLFRTTTLMSMKMFVEEQFKFNTHMLQHLFGVIDVLAISTTLETPLTSESVEFDDSRFEFVAAAADTAPTVPPPTYTNFDLFDERMREADHPFTSTDRSSQTDTEQYHCTDCKELVMTDKPNVLCFYCAFSDPDFDKPTFATETEVRSSSNVEETASTATVAKQYRDDLLKPYSKLYFWLCEKEEYKNTLRESSDSDDSDFEKSSVSLNVTSTSSSVSDSSATAVTRSPITIIDDTPSALVIIGSHQCPTCFSDECAEAWVGPIGALPARDEVDKENEGSNSDSQAPDDQSSTDLESIKNDVNNIRAVLGNISATNRVAVRRSTCFKDYLAAMQKKWFKAKAQLKVTFIGDSAIDDGGPSREFPSAINNDHSLDESATPIQFPPRRVPLSIKEKLQAEQERLSKLDIIEKVDKPTEWISSLVVTTKRNGKVRLCIDPKPLNKALKRNQYPLPTIEDVLPLLANARVFTVLDAKNGFWHIQLDEPSSDLTIFNTPWGRYRWLRMPFGLSPAPEEFQRGIVMVLEGLEGAIAIADDILVFGTGSTDEIVDKNHDDHLKAVLERCHLKGIKLNKEKMQFKQKQVSYMGHVITDEGLQPDPNKIKAIVNMPTPTDKEGVQRILGMANYVQRFAPKLTDVTKPLRDLIKKENEFVWDETIHSKALQDTKQILTEAPVLKYFDP
ncbi:hypothetical protein QZH41_001958 [Actinostola sp. cb2023]|nr:hypothetical protein QZH41_001958 [Actinostola sp. cb2023]